MRGKDMDVYAMQNSPLLNAQVAANAGSQGSGKSKKSKDETSTEGQTIAQREAAKETGIGQTFNATA
jgi:hypothetical protein